MGGWVDGLVGGWTDGWVDGWMGGWNTCGFSCNDRMYYIDPNRRNIANTGIRTNITTIKSYSSNLYTIKINTFTWDN